MPRLAATPDQIRATVLAMLTEAGDAAPPTAARFRRVVSVRKLRDRLGGGDPATLSRTLNAIEAEVVRAGLADLALPEIPLEIAEAMRALWQAAVAVQLDDVVRLRREAQQTAEAAQTARAEADMRVELLRQELSEVRGQLAARDTALAEACADQAAANARADEQAARRSEFEKTLATLQERVMTDERAHAEAVATVQTRYEALSKQLLQETAHQRDAVRAERAQLASQLKFAERRIAALEEERARLDTELASERAARQTAVGEASALKAVTASQRAQLDDLLRATLAAAPSAAKVARAPRSTGKPAGKPDHKPGTNPGTKRRDKS
ncbi:MULTISPECIES: DNA-binding protein [Burkholderiaceae]|uniref:DNA-binding protein n=1 Tax=Burkholderiaceae TaxID=119060 RepID=UPI000676599B|nr:MULTISPECIES: DNA-binding protein [Burkholderiaceae]KAI3590427.1 Chromosome segregation ATPase [Cupriavidus sp. U2]SDP60148.1 replication region DNA-binding N-term [Ralstonia sp. 25mfcol4.1]